MKTKRATRLLKNTACYKGCAGTALQANTNDFTATVAADFSPYGEYLVNSENTAGRYKFTEKARDNETGYDYFGARYYNNKLGVWLSVDPMIEKYPGWNPYNYTMNNPLTLVDPNGMDVGDYYSAHGAYLGTDGIDDEKIYLADSVNKDKSDKVISASNSNLLPISKSDFILLSATIYGEAGPHEDNWKEKFAIGNTIVNHIDKSGGSLQEKIKSIAYAATDGNDRIESFSNIRNENRSESMQTSIAGSINAIMKWKDYSIGATGWYGLDFKTNQHLTGSHFTNPNHNIFNITSQAISRNIYGGWTRESTAAFGETAFHKISAS